MTTEKKVDVTTLVPVESQDRVKKAVEFFNSVKALKVSTKEEYEKAIEILKDIKRTIDEMETDRKTAIEPYDPKTRAINEYYRSPRTSLENFAKVFSQATTNWYAAEQRRLREIQAKLEADAEAKRKAAEKKVEDEKKKAETYREQGRGFMAAKAEARAETAETVANNTVAPIVGNSAKMAGVSYKAVWKITVEDEIKAMNACINNPVLRNYVTLDVKGLEKLATVQKGRFQCDGVRVYEDLQQGTKRS